MHEEREFLSFISSRFLRERAQISQRCLCPSQNREKCPVSTHSRTHRPLRPHRSSIRVLWLCEIVETSACGAPQSSVKLHVKRDTPPISANFMKFQQLFLIGKFYTEFHEILSLANGSLTRYEFRQRHMLTKLTRALRHESWHGPKQSLPITFGYSTHALNTHR